MDTLRYVFAILLVVGLPPGILFWFWIHPFLALWRRLGLVWTYVIAVVAMMAMMWGLFAVRDRYLVTEYGTHGWLVAVGALFLAAAGWIAWHRRRFLTFKILAGVPELSGAEGAGSLLQDGAYAVIRHPRYVEVILGMAGYALIANYLAGYVVVAVSVPLIWGIVVIEERELQRRFGAEYDRYRARVPMFVPRWRRS